ncbi:MAG: HEAT repeat domain-containing protein, partial [Planctomycetes bacterium]|nr:HEAT repeat domain-containing protein [Planctomycetota bacterium]
GAFAAVTSFCEHIKNVQGILSFGNIVFAVGDGPDGSALYRITDLNDDGRSDAITKHIGFRGVFGEHGAHAVHLGPEGLLYVLHGNHVQPDVTADARSPYASFWEGDLVQPRHEDPNGHAAGIPAPGGAIFRTDMRGSFLERFAGGFRNPYDFAVNRDGELLTYDADMEWDIGAPWYRPTRINHVPPGTEAGWRSGWAKWPEYYLDSLPAALDIGPGSPTGVVIYDHVKFPQRLQGAMIVGDWATGQIHAIHLERHGATYLAKKSTLLKGRPLNVTGLDVGPDGALYFCTGGRGTDGGVYRIRWNGKVPPEASQLGKGIERALRQPQFTSDWARVRIAAVKHSLGDRWESELTRVINDRRAESKDRLRAVDLMVFFGPAPSPQLLTALAEDRDPSIRIKTARLMGVRMPAPAGGGSQFNPAYDAPLAKLLHDPDPFVRRVACESIGYRDPQSAPVDSLLELLAHEDRFLAFAARRALEKTPAEAWQQQVLTAESPRVFLQGATGLLAAYPSPPLALQILARAEALLERATPSPTPADDAVFLDTLRVIQLALHRGQITPRQVPDLGPKIASEYPTTNALHNRELVRLLAYLQPPEATRKLAAQVAADIPAVEKLQIAAYASRITGGWSTADKLAMLHYFEQARGMEGGYSVSGYLENFSRDFFTNLTLAERRQVIAAGENFPISTLSILARLPENPSTQILAEIRALDRRTEHLSGEPIARLRVGTVAVLGGSGEAESMAYLRNVYASNPDRRAPVAMSLTQNPNGENWEVLVDSLRTIEGVAAQEVLSALAHVDRRPETAEPFRNTILLGLRMPAAVGNRAVQLLSHWTDQKPTQPGAPVADQLAAWQQWYAETHPNELPAELPKESQPNKWSYDELVSFLESSEGHAGDPARGAAVFQNGQCINCHRCGGSGESLGPDLTTVAQRFQRKEILESMVYPSQVVSDQYASQIVIANGLTYAGVAAHHPDGGMVVLQSDGRKVELTADDIEEVAPSKTSVMPEGLLNPLTLEQVADLFAFLMNQPEPNLATRATEPPR